MGRPKKRPRADEHEPSDEHPGWYPELAANVESRSNQSGTLVPAGSDRSVDIGGAESFFTPDGGLQPWLVEQTQAWADDVMRDAPQSDFAAGIPALTPDRASHSPPFYNLPGEASSTHNLASEQDIDHFRDGSTSLLLDPMLDPSSTGLSFPGIPRCACLSTMYLTLTSLQAMDESFRFPFALHPLRDAMKATVEVADCTECPKSFLTGIQNTQIMGTVVVSIAERFGRILQSITDEATRAELAGEQKKFRLADLNTSTSHLHAGGLGCLAAFNLNLSPAEWRSMCKKVVRAEVLGPADGNDCCIHFSALTKRIEERQHSWHRRPPPADCPKDAQGLFVAPHRHVMNKEDYLCLKMIHYANRIVEKYDWS